mmetsp:Transcript_42475/g.140761  ORF Transcript_42475/g.140761 Transcript_42475/m.140761 type:complete len:270 (-) Transcript_42475:1395-2204(-)
MSSSTAASSAAYRICAGSSGRRAQSLHCSALSSALPSVRAHTLRSDGCESSRPWRANCCRSTSARACKSPPQIGRNTLRSPWKANPSTATASSSAGSPLRAHRSSSPTARRAGWPRASITQAPRPCTASWTTASRGGRREGLLLSAAVADSSSSAASSSSSASAHSVSTPMRSGGEPRRRSSLAIAARLPCSARMLFGSSTKRGSCSRVAAGSDSMSRGGGGAIAGAAAAASDGAARGAHGHSPYRSVRSSARAGGTTSAPRVESASSR